MPAIVSLAGENPFLPELEKIQMKVLLKGSFWGGGLCVTVVVVILGFSAGGWTLERTAERMAEESAEAAVIAVQVPICVAQGLKAPVANRAAFKREESAWNRGGIAEKNGWTTMPGGKEAIPGIAYPCAEKLMVELQDLPL